MSPRKPSAGVFPVTSTDRDCETDCRIRWRTLRPWLQSHGVPLVKIGRRWTFSLPAYLDALEREAGRATGRPAVVSDEDVCARATRRAVRR